MRSTYNFESKSCVQYSPAPCTVFAVNVMPSGALSVTPDDTPNDRMLSSGIFTVRFISTETKNFEAVNCSTHVRRLSG